MRSHHIINNHGIDIISLIDLKQIAMMQGKVIEESEHVFNEEKVYRLSGTKGLFTFNELKSLFLH